MKYNVVQACRNLNVKFKEHLKIIKNKENEKLL